MRKREATAYMVSVADDHFDGVDVNLTALAEECAEHFNESHLGGPLDDPDHDIWDWAIEAAEQYKESLRG